MSRLLLLLSLAGAFLLVRGCGELGTAHRLSRVPGGTAVRGLARRPDDVVGAAGAPGRAVPPAPEVGGTASPDEAVLTGLVVDRLTAMPRPVKERFFSSAYTVLGRVPDGWVVDTGTTPASWPRVAGLLGVGLVLLVAGLAGPLFASRGDRSDTPGPTAGAGEP